MNYNRFQIITFLRVVLICINAFLIAYFLGIEKRIFTLIFLSLILLSQIWDLYRYVSKTNRELTNFLFYLKHGETSFNFSTKQIESIFKDLNKSFNDIINDFQVIKTEKEKKDIFLQTTIEHIGVGIFSYNENEKIQIFNKSASELLGVNILLRLSDLDKIQNGLYQEIKSLNPGPPVILNIKLNNQMNQYSVKSIITKIKDEKITLLSIQDIKNELEENELLSYKKLIRVMNHEMMNSLTPITTLTSSIKRSFYKNDQIKDIEKLSQEDIDDTFTSIELIEERSRGLIEFIQKHRELTNIPNPSFKWVNIYELLQKTSDLFQNTFQDEAIEFKIESSDNLVVIYLDENLISQVLINLTKNALDALENEAKKEIIFKVSKNEIGKVKISVIDNGSGIEEEVKENLFVPFFTTKEHGSGIGLNFCRQVMRLHKGTILLETKKGKGTTFTLEF